MKKCRVALIHNIVAPYRIPVFEQMAAEPSIDFTVFYCATTHKHRNWEIDNSEGYNHRVLSGVCIRAGDINYHFNPSVVWELVRGRFDVVIIGGCTDFTTQIAFFVSRYTQSRLILWSEGIAGAQSRIGRLLSPLTDHIISNADAIIVPGELSRQYHIASGASVDRVFVGPSIVDNDFYIQQTSKLKPEKECQKRDLGINRNNVILYVGQLVDRKGLHILLAAYKSFKKEFPDSCLVIVGDGPLKEPLNRACAEEQIDDVLFTGWVSENEKVMYFTIADVFILPTLEDVWGLVVNEAMCCGLPVITTNVAGCSRDLIVPGENGYIINPKNSDEILQALVNVFKDPSRSELMGRRSLEIIQNGFSVQNTVDGFLSAIDYVREDTHENSDDTI